MSVHTRRNVCTYTHTYEQVHLSTHRHTQGYLTCTIGTVICSSCPFPTWICYEHRSSSQHRPKFRAPRRGSGPDAAGYSDRFWSRIVTIIRKITAVMILTSLRDTRTQQRRGSSVAFWLRMKARRTLTTFGPETLAPPMWSWDPRDSRNFNGLP